MAELFGVNVDTIGLHIRNIYREEELETSTYEESSVVRLEGKRQVKRSIRIYELDKSATCAESAQVQMIATCGKRTLQMPIAQFVFGEEVYPSVEEKTSAANKLQMKCFIGLCLVPMHSRGQKYGQKYGQKRGQKCGMHRKIPLLLLSRIWGTVQLQAERSKVPKRRATKAFAFIGVLLRVARSALTKPYIFRQKSENVYKKLQQSNKCISDA